MQTDTLPVCKLDLFDKGFKHFWISNLGDLLTKFPFLEFAHKHNFYAIVIIDSAQGEIIVDNEKVVLDDAKAIIIKPCCISRIDINRQAVGKIIFFSEDFFSLRYNNNILNQFAFLKREAKAVISLSESQKSRLSLFLELVQEEYLMQKNETQKVLRSYLNILLFELERICSPIGIVKNRNCKHDKIQQFEELIDKNYQSKKMPSSYAALMHVSANYLNKLCKEETGQTAGDLIRRRVAIEAQRLIHHTNFSINEIADKLGYENASYFVTFFKKQTHKTPEQFRKTSNQ